MKKFQKLGAILMLLFISTSLVGFVLTTVTSIAIKNSTLDSSPIGGTTPSTAVVTLLTINQGVSSAGTGFKHFRVTGGSCTTPGGQGTTCQTTSISIPGTAYADTNYSLVCELDGSIATNTATPAIMGAASKAAGSFTLTVIQVGTAAASYGAIDCITVHD